MNPPTASPYRRVWTWLTQPRHQDAETVRNLRLGVGVIGTFLPLTLIIANLILDDKVIVPASMSGSYYTSARNLFVGSLCALGVFLIGYRGDTRLQDLCTSFAGLCALLVAFAPIAPPGPATEAAWINYLHESAAGALIFTLGLFCIVVFAQLAKPRDTRPAMADHPSMILYLTAGIIVLVSGGFALYTGVWPTNWSTGWPSMYLFEAVAVFAFGSAWIAAPAVMIWSKLKLPPSRARLRQRPPRPIRTAQGGEARGGP